jgi:hypothetical protein
MNIAKVRNSADFVNYVKPGMEMVDLEIEAAILSKSITTGYDDDPTLGEPVQPGGGGGIKGSAYNPRTKRR